jgi:ABC-2 type transport system ATP-binding protein
MSEAVVVADLRHHYSGVEVLKGISFTIHTGEVFGLLGPNGAGKTTLCSILTSQLRPAGGRVSLLGLDPVTKASELRPRIGLAAHELRMSEYLTGLQAMKFQGHLYGLSGASLDKRVRELISLVGLEHKQNGLIGSYSEGMRRRLNVALALVHDPEVVFLDEPTVGLDPLGRRQVWNVIWELKARGKTILLTTHYMEEAEFLCGRIALMDRGVVAALGTPSELKARMGTGKIIEVGVEASAELVDEVSRLIPEGRVYRSMGLNIVTKDPEPALQRIMKRFISDPGYGGTRIVLREPSLEDVFIELTGRSLKEESKVTDKEETKPPNASVERTGSNWNPFRHFHE